MNPRIIRLRDAPAYLGKDKNTFNRKIRPHLTEKKDKRAVSFDRLELDAWADTYFYGNGRSDKEAECVNYQKGLYTGSGKTVQRLSRSTSKSNTGAGNFAGLAERLIQKKRQGG